MRTTDTNAMLDELIGIQDTECAKPVGEIDADRVRACTGLLLALTGEDPPPDRVLEQKQKALLLRLRGRKTVPFRKGLRRKLLIAAVLVALIVAFSVSLLPTGTSDESLIHRWQAGQNHAQRVDFGDYMTLLKGKAR